MIAIDHVTREFRVGSKRVQALQGVTLSVEPGQCVGVLGDNGAGKTTLLRIVATLLCPTSGTVLVGGHDVVREAQRVRDLMAVVLGGERGLFGQLTGRQNLEFFGMLRGRSRRELQRLIPAAIERAGLDDAAERRVETYSKGMRQRLHLAAGSLVRAPVLLLDEPTVGLDPTEAQRTRDLVAALRLEGTTIVLTSHLLRDVETLADRIVMLRNGRIEHDLPARDFLRLTDHVGTVTLTSSRDPAGLPLESIGMSVSHQLHADAWEARIQVRSWSPDVFRALCELAATPEVSIDIEATSLEDVYQSLSTQQRTP